MRSDRFGGLSAVAPVAAFLAALVLALPLGGCGEGRAGTEWAGTVDTLPGGAVLVRNPASGVWVEGEGWTIREELRIGSLEGSGPEVFGQVAALEVDALGRIYVAEGQAHEIRVFDAEGRFVRTIGRKGGGPGEFEDVSALFFGPQGNLWVVDQQNARYSVFDTAGAFLTSHRRPVPGMIMPWPGLMDDEGRIYEIGFAMEGPDLLRFGTDLERADTLPMPSSEGPYFEHRTDGGRMRASVPFAPGLVWRLDPRGHLWFGISEEYRIVERSPEGDTLRIIEKEHAPVAVTAEERTEAMERLEWFTRQGGRVDASRLPGTKPAFRRFHVDEEGHLWVVPSVAGEDAGGTADVFDIFDPRGRYLGRVTPPFPLPYSPVLFRDGRLYTVAADELGVPYVVRARILREEVR